MASAQPDQEHAEFVRRWTREIIGSSYVPMARQDVEALLSDCLDHLLEALAAEEFTSDPAYAIGVRLVRNNFTVATALERTACLLAEGLPSCTISAPPARADLLAARTIALVSALAAGYAAELRERVLVEQEVIKEAVLRARDAAEAALEASEARFRTVFTASPLGIARADLDGRIESANASMAAIFRTSREALTGCEILDLADEAYRRELREADAQLAAGEFRDAEDRFHQIATLFTTVEGEQVWTQISASLVRNSAGEPEYQILQYEDITNQHMLEMRLRHQATHDPLTNLANRTRLRDRMEKALAETVTGRRVALCYLDLDGFKAINDSLGHPIGDDLLRAVAARIDAIALEETGTAARMGGDEFVVLLPDSPGTGRVAAVVERLLTAVTTPVRVRDHELNASASIGVVERPVQSTDADELLRDADTTLYRAKEDGKAQWMLFDAELNASAKQRFTLSATMPRALDDDEFFVEYEPMVRLSDGAVLGVTARVRWDHPDLGELGPADFLPLAEETGLVVRLGKWLLRQVCEHATGWQRRLGDRAPLVGVDLSARQFNDPELVGDVQQILRETGMKSEYLRLSVPEDALFDEQGDPRDELAILHDMGIGLALGDLARGYGGLARLRDVPLGVVTLGGPATAGFAVPDGVDPVDEHVVTSLVWLAHLLDLSVVVDGVRTAAQLERLAATGADAGQGPHWGGPASANEIEIMINKGMW